VIFQILKEY